MVLVDSQFSEATRRGKETRRFARTYLLSVIFLHFVVIVAIVTAWVVTDLDDKEVVCILSWQFFHLITLILFGLLIAVFVQIQRSMRHAKNQPPKNLIWAGVAFEALELVAAAILFIGGISFFKPVNAGESNILCRVNIFFLVINALAFLFAIFGIVVLVFLRQRAVRTMKVWKDSVAQYQKIQQNLPPPLTTTAPSSSNLHHRPPPPQWP